MTTAEAARLNIDSLRARFSGDVVAPGDAAYDEARLGWNLSADQRPAIVAIPASVADVIEAVDFARNTGLRVAPQGTGHNATAMGSLENAILLKTHRLDGYEIDVKNQRARAEAGVIWEPVVEAASEHGLHPLAGSSPDVGIVGYSLGGGMGWVARKHGLAANSVLAIEVVTADGNLIRTDADNHPDLFWALRGGGGNFGVVTAIEFKLYPVSELYAGMMMWPVERAAEVLKVWREWTLTSPDEATSSARILQLPPIEELPEFLRGRSFINVEIAYLGGEADGAELIAPLRDLGPEIDTFSMVPPAALIRLHMDPEDPMPGSSTHMMLDDIGPEGIDALVESTGPALMMAELRQLGGALGRPAPNGGVTSQLNGSFALFAGGVAPTPEVAAMVQEQAAVLTNALAPWDSGNRYSNFDEHGGNSRPLFTEVAYKRLRAVKAEYDAHNVFQANHEISA